VRILVGLGNPGAKYERTRHNLGFRIARLAAEKLGVELDQTRWNAVLGTGRARGEQVAIVLPQTFMNLSGESVGHGSGRSTWRSWWWRTTTWTFRSGGCR